jgi:hypothetical protein
VCDYRSAIVVQGVGDGTGVRYRDCDENTFDLGLLLAVSRGGMLSSKKSEAKTRRLSSTLENPIRITFAS